MSKIAYIILASGSGQRFGCELPKQFLKLKGKPILEYSLDFFYSLNENKEVILVLNSFFLNEISKYINLNKYPELIIKEGGTTRQLSVFNAIKNINSNLVLIHDSARPILDQELYLQLRQEITHYPGVVPVKRSNNTLYELDAQQMTLQNIPDRNNLFQVETPQLFQTSFLKEAHLKAQNDKKFDFTDDGQMLKYYNLGETKCVISKKINLKITTPQDLLIAENLEFSY